jgi:hypothetical protein
MKTSVIDGRKCERVFGVVDGVNVRGFHSIQRCSGYYSAEGDAYSSA